MVDSILKRYEQFRPFTDSEAWWLFRLAAIGEAVGWSLLILGILFKQYIIIGNDIAVQIAGRIHGMLFLAYIAAVVVLYPSLGWGRGRTIIAGLASVPPYGSLMFEQWAAYGRRRSHLRQHTLLATYTVLLLE
jgi:integral membrane protein